MKRVVGICAAAVIFAAGSASAQDTDERTRVALVQDEDYYEMILKVAATTTLQFKLTAEQEDKLEGVIRLLRSENTEAAAIRWKDLITNLTRDQFPMDVSALVQYVLRESYLENNEDLRNCAESVLYYNEQKKAVRNFIVELRENFSRLGDSQTVKVSNLVLNPFQPRTFRDTRRVAIDSETTSFELEPVEIRTREELEHMIARWEEEQDSLEVISEESMLRLQMQIQRQVRMMTTITHIMKVHHDIATQAIRNMR